MNLLLALLLALGFLLGPGDAPDVPKARKGPFALTNARIVTVTNGTIENGTLVIRDDTIAALGADVQPPADAEIIDCAGLTLYPGLIDGGTRLGLVEVSSLSETRDYNEVGELTPEAHALTAVNPSSVAIPVTRVNGVTTVITEPSGGLMPGTSALINLVGYTPDQMYAGFQGVMIEFPSTSRRGPWDERSEEEIEKQAEKAISQLDDIWERARLYARIDSAHAANPDAHPKPEYAPEMEALLPVVRGTRKFVIEVNRSSDITAAIEWAASHDLTDRVIFSGVREGWRVADNIAEAGIPVLAGPVIALPMRESDRYDKAYANPGLMQQAGVQVALRSGEAENVRNLPYHAGFAAAYGMGREQALRAVTIVPARIFGVADRLGSLEVGKQANLFAATGDPFETATDIEHLFISGYKVPLESRHTRLYDEFLNRNPGLEK